MRAYIPLFILIGSFCILTCSSSLQEKQKLPKKLQTEYDSVLEALSPLHSPMPPIQEGDWRWSNPNERPQSFADYYHSPSIRPTNKRNRIYIQPLGRMDSAATSIMNTVAEYLHIFFDLEVEMMDSLPISEIPVHAQRRRQGYHQLYTSYLLHEHMAPKLPGKAAAYVAFTTYDLYPRPDWNFVFGQGSPTKRVGVYSMARYGDPNADSASYQLCLSRVLKVATHEIGHIFGIKHCQSYSCNMNGSNSLPESDSRPHLFCPIDLMKLSWGLDLDRVERFRKMKEFWRENGFGENGAFCEESRQALAGESEE